LHYENGDKYIGEFLDGMRDGNGTYYYECGEKFEGKWVKDIK